MRKRKNPIAHPGVQWELAAAAQAMVDVEYGYNTDPGVQCSCSSHGGCGVWI
jgi:hypothetical protein